MALDHVTASRIGLCHCVGSTIGCKLIMGHHEADLHCTWQHMDLPSLTAGHGQSVEPSVLSIVVCIVTDYPHSNCCLYSFYM